MCARAGLHRCRDLYPEWQRALRRPGVDVEQLLAEVPVHPEVDVATAGRHALYFRRLIARETSSRLNRLVQMPVYKELTNRNWNTTQKLAEMANAAAT